MKKPFVVDSASHVDELKAEIARMRPVLRAARRVIWYDWSDNDTDAVAAIEALRRAVTKAKGK